MRSLLTQATASVTELQTHWVRSAQEPGGVFLQNDRDVTGMDSALRAEYLGHFNGK